MDIEKQTLQPAPEIGTITDPGLDPGWSELEDRLVVDLDALAEEIRSAARDLYQRTATQERDAATLRDERRIAAEIAAEVARTRALDAALAASSEAVAQTESAA